jgi:hypothetical protein
MKITAGESTPEIRRYYYHLLNQNMKLQDPVI